MSTCIISILQIAFTSLQYGEGLEALKMHIILASMMI
jgi:hypothetical protein